MGINNQDQRRQMMLDAPIPHVVTKMAIPTIVAFIINAVYSLADTFFVSNLGTNATAAVSVNASLDQLIMMTSSLLAVGANSYIARLLGQNNEKKEEEPKVKVLIVPKFEIGEMSGDETGEAQLFYEHYCAFGKAEGRKGSESSES